MTRFEIQWQSPEFEYREKGVSWYWLSIILAVVVLGLAIWQKNFLFGFFIVIAEILILVWGNREPRLVNFVLSEKGLAIDGGEPSPYEQITSFAIDTPEEGVFANLFISFRRKLKPSLHINIPKERLAEIQKALTPLLPQQDPEQSFLDTLEELIRF